MTTEMVRRDARLTVQRRDAATSSYDAEQHTVTLTATTSEPVKRWSWEIGDYLEILSFEPDHVDLGRVEKGQCPLLDSHSRWSVSDQLGKVLSASLEGDKLSTPVKFGVTQAAKDAELNVEAGILTGVSIGYRVLEMVLQKTVEGLAHYLVTKWELLEVSLCPVPADPNAGVRSDNGSHPCVIMETRSMKPETTAAETSATQDDGARTASETATTERAAETTTAKPADANAVRMSAGAAMDFAEDCRLLGVSAEQARTWADSMTPDAARVALSRHAADAQRGRAPVPAGAGGRVTVDERDTMRSAISDALLNRHNPAHKLTDPAREFRGMSLLEIARRNLERNGEKVSGLGRREIADLALRQHSTSDFPNVLSNVAGRTLRGAYDAAPQTFKAWQRRASVSDFKQVTRLQMGGAPSFLLVPEGGQFKFGTIGEAKEVYALATYGRRFAVTRQVLINDDLDAFTRIPEMWGRAAADFESDAAYAPLIANPNMGDGNALFSTQHGNLQSSGAAPGETTWSAAEQAFAAQVGIEGRPISVQPKFMIVAPKHKVPALKLRGSEVSQGASATPGTTNVYQNAFDVIVESRLARSSGATPWFAAADSAQIDTIEYAYLEGDDGVFLDERAGFDVDGIEYKARLDFAVKAIDYRGLYENVGDS